MPYGAGNAPSGWLLCDGTVVRKSDYTELWNAIGHNFLDASLLDDAGVNTFALPIFEPALIYVLKNVLSCIPNDKGPLSFLILSINAPAL